MLQIFVLQDQEFRYFKFQKEKSERGEKILALKIGQRFTKTADSWIRIQVEIRG